MTRDEGRGGWRLTQKQQEAIVRFDPGVYHGTGTPSGVSGSVKGRLCHIGMLERVWTDKVSGSASFILTDVGEQERAKVLREIAREW